VDTTIISSTFLLTLLMIVGLFFFIRASVKDRTKKIQFLSTESEEILWQKLQQYFETRAYRVIDWDKEKKQVTLEGFVQPSWFLAIFLTILAGIGLSCLALVLFWVYPTVGNLVWGLIILAPLAGIFYWRKAGRLEQVSLSIQTDFKLQPNQSNLLTVTAHRDELLQLQQNLSLELVE
jgi:hypothetical protein